MISPTQAEHGVVKPKQTKSRNGCLTCKTKRLKCDETKPGCQQCHKRSVVCGGYKKDFKWKPFEETVVGSKTTAAPKKNNGGSMFNAVQFTPTKPDVRVNLVQYPARQKQPEIEVPNIKVAEMEDQRAHETSYQTSTPPMPFHTFPSPVEPCYFNQDTPLRPSEPIYHNYKDHATRRLSSIFEESTYMPMSPRPSFSGQSPRLIDLLLPGSELNARPGSVVIPPVVMMTPPPTSPLSSQLPNLDVDMDEDDVEEIVREPLTPDINSSMGLSMQRYSIHHRPKFEPGSTEMLMMRFDKQTCGILSVKDGPTENPWRTLVWPLARDSPALYHAIASMTAFHGSQEKPSLRVSGMEHMRNSIRALASGIGEMRTETALATTLALAFSESWDQHISTGIEHLRGAKILVKQALITHEQKALKGSDLQRLRFLCSTFVYMDVIARLTSVLDEEDNDNFLESLQATSLFHSDSEIDPLMGCSATLFPLIGRAANLCRKVRNFKTNSLHLIAEASDVKARIEAWSPPPMDTFRSPEDPTSDIQHAISTAEAYRYATLLYLHQAVPELPSLDAASLAKKVLICLASVPLSSRLVIVQIYPLLAAGCEAIDPPDRSWIEDRWQNMASRMWIGNIDRCWEVMQEVWARRDHQKAIATAAAVAGAANASIPHSDSDDHGMSLTLEDSRKRKYEDDESSSTLGLVDFGSLVVKKQKDNNGTAAAVLVHSTTNAVQPSRSPVEGLDPDMSVKGHLHWVGVMKDWGWEILLG